MPVPRMTGPTPAQVAELVRAGFISSRDFDGDEGKDWWTDLWDTSIPEMPWYTVEEALAIARSERRRTTGRP